MKNILFLTLFFQSVISYGQVGINLSKPKGVFHIDGNKNNPLDGTLPNEAQQSDDFIILRNGNVGVGTTTPDAKLEIKSNDGIGFRLKDGTQGIGKSLISDSVGNASWKYLGLDLHLGVFKLGRYFKLENLRENNFNFDPNNPASHFYGTGSYIDLPPGKWLVVLDLYTAFVPVLEYDATGIPLSKDDWVWLRYSFSDEDGYVTASVSNEVQLTQDFVDSNNRVIGGGLSGPSESHIRSSIADPILREDLHGQFLLKNSTANIKRYFLAAGAISASKNSLPGYLKGGGYAYGAFHAVPAL